MRIDRPEHYFRAAIERQKQAWRNYKQERSYALAMYLAGVAVECLLRAFISRKGNFEFDPKHDLVRLFTASGLRRFDPVALKRKGYSAAESEVYFMELQTSLNDVFRLWHNSYRFASKDRLLTHLKKCHLDPKPKGDIRKARALTLLSAAEKFFDRGMVQWIS